ncbi:PIN domain-like protein [Coprinopsis sp. MPI-PUGE-AT-0042]|nr:PIN domain-like protein [Coprinopsis sp. MPI-PUGE-AT-0042]
MTAPWASSLTTYKADRQRRSEALNIFSSPQILVQTPSIAILQVLNIQAHSIVAVIMGIEGLWKIVEPARKPRHLMELSVMEGWAPRANTDGFLCIGIDTSIWINQADSVFGIQGHHYQVGENPELNNFFQRLVQLRGLPAVFVFVIDGADQPIEKHGGRTAKTPHALTASLREFIEAFGYYSVQAPGEAEAELAKLNAGGQLDATMTDDSDALVFGAKYIIRSSSLDKNKDNVHVYSASHIEMHPGVQLSCNRLALFVILRGGDYSVGLPKCGEKISYAIACCNDLADALVDLVTLLMIRSMQSIFDLNGGTPLSTSLEECPLFPSLAILGIYLDPVTTSMTSVDWSPRAVDLPAVIRLCERSFAWGTREQLTKRFLGARNLWPSLVRSAFLLPPDVGAVLHGKIVTTDTPTTTGPHKYGKVTRVISHGYNAQFGLQGYRVEVEVKEFGDTIASYCTGLRPSSTGTTRPKKKGITHGQKPKKATGNVSEKNGTSPIWVPAVVLRWCLPDMILNPVTPSTSTLLQDLDYGVIESVVAQQASSAASGTSDCPIVIE